VSVDAGDRTEASDADDGRGDEAGPDSVVTRGVADDGTDGFVWCESTADGTDRKGAAEDGGAADEAGGGADEDTAGGAGGVAESDATDGTGGGAADGGFEWCTSANDVEDDRARDDAESAATAERGGADTAATASDGLEHSLPPDLVTTTRRSGTDDEAVARLSALRRTPGRGRWERVAAEFDVEPTASHGRDRDHDRD
jgi:hypothetical protein